MAQQYSGQSDAATMKPRLVPKEGLMARDNSGGRDAPESLKTSGDFGDGGKTVAPKKYLTPSS